MKAQLREDYVIK